MALMNLRAALLRTRPTASTLRSTCLARMASGKNDSSPTGYTLPPKELMDDRPLPKSQNEHPGPTHDDGEAPPQTAPGGSTYGKDGEGSKTTTFDADLLDFV